MWILKLRRIAKAAGREALILYFAVLNPATPIPLRVAAVAALGYLLSPVDLVPDLLLVGLVDDLILLSLGLPFLVRRLPPKVLADCSARADAVLEALGLGGARPGKTAARGRKSAPHAPVADASADSQAADAASGAAKPAARRPTPRRRSARSGGGVVDVKIVKEMSVANKKSKPEATSKPRRKPAG